MLSLHCCTPRKLSKILWKECGRAIKYVCTLVCCFVFPPHKTKKKKQPLKQQGTMEKCVRDPIPSPLTWKNPKNPGNAGWAVPLIICVRVCVCVSWRALVWCIIWHAAIWLSLKSFLTTHQLVFSLKSVFFFLNLSLSLDMTGRLKVSDKITYWYTVNATTGEPFYYLVAQPVSRDILSVSVKTRWFISFTCQSPPLRRLPTETLHVETINN